MKTFVLFFLLAITAGTSEAQLLKRIRDKAVQVVDTKSKSKSSSSNSSSQDNPGNSNDPKKSEKIPENCTLVFTLGENERFYHDESRIIVKNNSLSHAFVIKNTNKEFFLIEDGKRTGPFPTAPLPSTRNSGGNNYDKVNPDIKIGNDQKDAVTAQYTKSINGKLYIVFNGKNYGPYDYIAKILVSPDKKHFFAVVTIGGENNMTAKMGMGNTYMISDEGLKIQAGKGSNVPLRFYVSRNFKHCMVTVLDQKTQMVTTVTSTGKTAESSMADLFSNGEGVTFVSDNGDIVLVPGQSPTQVFVNGKEVATFSTSILSAERLFLMPDYSKSVYYQTGKLYRANGTEINLTGVLFPNVLSINNETAVYYFKFIKSETGAKEIYLCKIVF